MPYLQQENINDKERFKMNKVMEHFSRGIHLMWIIAFGAALFAAFYAVREPKKQIQQRYENTSYNTIRP